MGAIKIELNNMPTMLQENDNEIDDVTRAWPLCFMSVHAM